MRARDLRRTRQADQRAEALGLERRARRAPRSGGVRDRTGPAPPPVPARAGVDRESAQKPRFAPGILDIAIEVDRGVIARLARSLVTFGENRQPTVNRQKRGSQSGRKDVSRARSARACASPSSMACVTQCVSSATVSSAASTGSAPVAQSRAAPNVVDLRAEDLRARRRRLEGRPEARRTRDGEHPACMTEAERRDASRQGARRASPRRTRGSSRASNSGPIALASARRRTRLLSISDARVSRSAPQTSSAASSVLRPGRSRSSQTGLARRGERRSCDQAIVARSVAWRGSASRCAGRSSRSSRRSRIAWGCRRRVRAAASSNASGKPSRRSHSIVTSSRRLDRGVDAPRAIHEEGHSLFEHERTQVEPRLGGDVQRLAARHEEPERRCARRQGRERRRDRREELLDVVQEQVGAPLADPCGDPLRRRVVLTEGVGDRRENRASDRGARRAGRRPCRPRRPPRADGTARSRSGSCPCRRAR